MNDGVVADKFARQAEGAGGNLAPSRVLGREAEKVGGGNSRWENGAVLRNEIPDLRWIGLAFSEGGMAGSVINALAQALDLSLLSEAGKGLDNGRNRKIPEIRQAPQLLSAGLDTLPDEGRDMTGTTGWLSVLVHRDKDGHPGIGCQVFLP